MRACCSPEPSCCNRSTTPRVKTRESPRSCRPSILTASDVVDRNTASARDSGPRLPAPSRVRHTSSPPFLTSSHLPPSCGDPPASAAAAPLEIGCSALGVSRTLAGAACGNKRAGAGDGGERPEAAAAAAGTGCKLPSSRSTRVRFASKIPHSSESPQHTERQPPCRSWEPVVRVLMNRSGFCLRQRPVTGFHVCRAHGFVVDIITSTIAPAATQNRTWARARVCPQCIPCHWNPPAAPTRLQSAVFHMP